MQISLDIDVNPAILHTSTTKKENKMKLIQKKFKHSENGFVVKVETCNSRIVTTKNENTGETIKFNRPKFEFMINKKVFEEIE